MVVGVAALLAGCAGEPFTLLPAQERDRQKFEQCNLDDSGPAGKKCDVLIVNVTGTEAGSVVTCRAALAYDTAIIYYRVKQQRSQGRITWKLSVKAPASIEKDFEFVEYDPRKPDSRGIWFKKGSDGTWDDPKRSGDGKQYSWELVSAEPAMLDHVAKVQFKRGDRVVPCEVQDPVIINLPGSHARR